MSASKSLPLSTLFTTMLESNALLREEIDQMEGRKLTPRESVSSEHMEQSAVNRVQEERDHLVAVQSGDIHSKSLPPYLLETSVSAQPESTEKPLMQPFSSRQTVVTSGEMDGSICSNGSMEGDSEGADIDKEYSHGTEGEEDSRGEYSDDDSTPSLAEQSHHEQPEPDDLCPPPLSITSVSSTEVGFGGHCENDPFASPGESMIESMWDNFSVEEYAPPIKHKDRKKQVSVSKPIQQAWSHRFTIPKPFSMTVRDEGKPKKKSRMLIAAERERWKQDMQDELECQKRFRALPVPATTYVALDELQIHTNKQQMESECHKVVQSIKPFCFMQREEEKRRKKCETADRSGDHKRVFKAKPVPHNILSPHISEQLKEKEEYRKILMKVRSHDMLAKARLPSSMQHKHRKYTVQNLMRERVDTNRQSEAFVTKEHTFHPKIRPDIPDHEQLYAQHQQHLAVRKEVRPPTTPKPFVLRTSSTPPRRSCLQNEQPQPSSPSLLSSTRSVDAQVSHSQPMYSVQMTETAKLRQSFSDRRLAEAAEREMDEEAVRRGKREQHKQLRSKVIQKVQSYDHSAWLQEKQKERLQRLRFVCSYDL